MATYAADILNLRSRYFVFWLPSLTLQSPPLLLLGTYSNGTFQLLVEQAFQAADSKPGLWLLDPSSLSPPLPDNTVFHYWFQVAGNNATPVTDPFAFTVDYSAGGNGPAGARVESLQPPAVIKFRAGQLWACDIDGTEPTRPAIPSSDTLPANNHMVLYELPTSWARSSGSDTCLHADVGTFADVRALFDVDDPGCKFASIAAVKSAAILKELGINALELLPAADAKAKDTWGYATANYFAPDSDLGSSSELVSLVHTLHAQGVRLFTDVVMAFGHDSYGDADTDVFHIDPSVEPDNPDSYQSHALPGSLRDGYGGKPWRYVETVLGSYDPVTGASTTVHPSWAFHQSHLTRWMADFCVGGLRLDSVNNISNWDFVKAYKEKAWELYNARYAAADPSRFLVIGEELSLPIAMLQQGCLDALWNENWLQRLRAVLLGEPWGGTGGISDNFEWTVRKLVDCRQDELDGGRFTDGAQAIIYITSHDIEGYHKNRLYNFCQDYRIWNVAQRARLAFALLLTSVGVPMIFAGEEFADQEDQSRDMLTGKQNDPVNYARRDDPSDGAWRPTLFAYVARLVRFRTSCPALGVDDTDVFHVDDSRGGKIMAWQRGGGSSGTPSVVVVANFTDDDTPGTEYNVPNWPDRDVAGWREISQDRDVPAEWVGKEPLYAWEAKIYTHWRL